MHISYKLGSTINANQTERLRKKQEAWEQTKAKGMWNFVLWTGGVKFGSLFAVLFIGLWFVLRTLGPVDGVVDFTTALLFSLVGAPLAGLGFGLLMWLFLMAVDKWAKKRRPPTT